MNEKIKSFFIGIGTALVGMFAVILGRLLHNRRTTDSIGTDLSGAERTCAETERTTSEAIATNTELGTTIERGQSILQEIRNQKMD